MPRQSSSSTTTKKSAKPSKKKATQSSKSTTQAINVPDLLHSHAELFLERNKVYGDNFIHFGKVMSGIFPRGLTLTSEEDFNRFCIFVQVISKATRYGQNMARNKGHKDSLDDTSVYAAMLSEFDRSIGL